MHDSVNNSTGQSQKSHKFYFSACFLVVASEHYLTLPNVGLRVLAVSARESLVLKPSAISLLACSTMKEHADLLTCTVLTARPNKLDWRARVAQAMQRRRARIMQKAV